MNKILNVRPYYFRASGVRRKKVKKSKVLIFSVIAIMLISMLGACGNSNDKASGEASGGDTSLEDLKERGELVLGCDDAFPPMGFDDKGTLVGFDIDLAREVAKRIGVDFVPTAIDWKTKELELTSNKIDVIWNGYTITEERIGKVQFTKPYLENAQQVVVKADSDIKSLDDLKGKIIGFQIESAASEVFEASDLKGTEKAIQEYDDFQMALLDLKSSDRVDAIIVDKILIEYAMQQDPGTFKTLAEPMGTEYFGIGCRPGEVALADAIDKALDEMMEDGTIDEICAKWFESNIVIRNVDRLTAADFK